MRNNPCTPFCVRTRVKKLLLDFTQGRRMLFDPIKSLSQFHTSIKQPFVLGLLPLRCCLVELMMKAQRFSTSVHPFAKSRPTSDQSFVRHVDLSLACRICTCG